MWTEAKKSLFRQFCMNDESNDQPISSNNPSKVTSSICERLCSSINFFFLFVRTNCSQRLSCWGASLLEPPLVHQARQSPGHQTGQHLHSHIRLWQRYEETEKHSSSVEYFAVVFVILPAKGQPMKWSSVFWTTGDFKPLHYEVFGSDTNITVAEVTKGKSNMETFTLLWGGIPTKPITFNATASEVCCAKMSFRLFLCSDIVSTRLIIQCDRDYICKPLFSQTLQFYKHVLTYCNNFIISRFILAIMFD